MAVDQPAILVRTLAKNPGARQGGMQECATRLRSASAEPLTGVCSDLMPPSCFSSTELSTPLIWPLSVWVNFSISANVGACATYVPLIRDALQAVPASAIETKTRLVRLPCIRRSPGHILSRELRSVKLRQHRARERQ